MGIGTGTGTGDGPELIGSNILYGNVHTGLRQGKVPGPVVSFLCSLNEPLLTRCRKRIG